MSIKAKSISLSKKTSNSLPMKEIFQQNTLATEILRLIISRSEDIVILKSISDRKTGRLRLQSSFAEKTLQEVESKEEWRLSKEEYILPQLINARLEAFLHKKQFEKLIRKMLKINTQFEEDPTENEMSLSEIHVQKIMNIKIGPENTIITYNEKGQSWVTVPSATVSASSWKEFFSQPVKLLEAFLSGDVVNLYPSIYFSVKHSRNNYQAEIARQKQAIEEGSNLLTLNIAVIITSKKSKNSLPIKKSFSPPRKNNTLPEPDYKMPLFKMFLDMNSEISKSIKSFSSSFYERNSDEKPRLVKIKNPVEKALRLRNYEKYSAVSPWIHNISNYPLTTVRTLINLQTMPQILFDLENVYFEETKTFADRIKAIHSCIVIQKFFRKKKIKKINRAATMIQKHIRGYIGRKSALMKKLQNMKKIYHWERLKHWYPLLVNLRREKKSKKSDKDYNSDIGKIIIIQKVIKGYLIRKKVTYWKRIFAAHKHSKEEIKFYTIKIMLWKANFMNEDLAINYSKDTDQDIYEFIAQNQSKQKKKDEKYVNDMIKVKEKSEKDIRKKFLAQAKVERLKVLE